jgi:hypothetical protein
VWRLTGAQGDGAELPVLLEKSPGTSDDGTPESGVEELSSSSVQLESVGANIDQSGWELGWRVLNWPGKLKLTARLKVRAVPIPEMHPEKTSALSDLARQVAGVDGLEVENGVTELGGNLIYLDPQRKHWVFQIWNRKAKEQISRAWKLGAGGNPARAAIGAISTSVPLGAPALPRGVYVVWWVQPGGHGKPHIEISTPDDKRRARLPDWTGEDQGGGTCFLSDIPGLGSVFLRYWISEVPGDSSNYAFGLGLSPNGIPDDKHKLGVGWIKIPKP